MLRTLAMRTEPLNLIAANNNNNNNNNNNKSI